MLCCAGLMRMGLITLTRAMNILGGKSEPLLPDTLAADYPRGSFCIANKLPDWSASCRNDMEKLLPDANQLL